MNLLKGLVAWGSVLLLILSIWFAFSSEDLEAIAVEAVTLKQRKEILARLESLPEREVRIREALDRMNDGLEERSLYVGDVTAVRTQVQRDIRGLAAAAKIQVGSMRPLGARRSEGRLDQSVVQLNFNASYEELLAFLQRLEEAEPMLRPNKVSVAVRQASTVSSAAVLAVTMDVTGYLSKERPNS